MHSTPDQFQEYRDAVRDLCAGFPPEYFRRKFRETRLYQVAAISTNLIYAYIAEHVLGLPRSF